MYQSCVEHPSAAYWSAALLHEASHFERVLGYRAVVDGHKVALSLEELVQHFGSWVPRSGATDGVVDPYLDDPQFHMLRCRNGRKVSEEHIEFDMAGPLRQPPDRPVPKPDLSRYPSRDYMLRDSFAPDTA
ncbi:MAG: hypothetical protein IMF16_06810 [Proteobacteria bacterium]|nr:hypothetical protein [Pseudomonadota bacterium]